MSILRDWVWENYLMSNHNCKTEKPVNKELKNVLDQGSLQVDQESLQIDQEPLQVEQVILIDSVFNQVICLQS